MRKAKEFVKNENRVSIVKCCASCRFNGGIDTKSGVRRKCQKGGHSVFPFHLCAGWEMNPALGNAGTARGKVKKPEYILFLHQHIMRYSIDDIRILFEKDNGSIYSF